jgi:hypothetical protein
MRILSLFLLTLALSTGDAHAGVVVSIWSPGVAVFDPYGPEYVPQPRSNYVWVRGGYDEFGYYIPGYWQPVAGYPGFVWAEGYWSGRVYYEGYWRPQYRTGQVWIPGYYVGGQYTRARWVDEGHARAARSEAHDRARAHGPAPRRSAQQRQGTEHHAEHDARSERAPRKSSGDDRSRSRKKKK